MSDQPHLKNDPDHPLARDSAPAGEARQSAEDDLVGSSLGRFRVLSLLGKGGMGVVYLAKDEALHREVALKVLAPDAAEDPERKRHLLQEARAAAAVTHANIAIVYEVGEAQGRLYFAMEHVHGESLAARLARGQIDMREVLSSAKQMLEGLAKAHRAGIIHRDLKPDNVMVDNAGRIKILDFGLAKFIHESPERGDAGGMQTEEGHLLGTPSFMSPEQAAGLPVDARSDIFSFGIVLYQMVTGELPFRGANFLKILTAIERDEPAPPSQKRPDLSPNLERVLLKCLRKAPAERYADAGEVLLEFEQETPSLRIPFPIRTPDPLLASTPASTQPPKRRSRGRFLAGLLVVVVVCGMAWLARPKGTATTAQATASASPSSPSSRTAPTALTELPLPTSSNPEALAAYKRGLLALRMGNGWPDKEFRRAIELDPAFGAAYVRLVAGVFERSILRAQKRVYAQKANELVAMLSERDTAILDAFDPVIRSQPSNPAEQLHRLSLMIERWPGDAELFLMRSWSYRANGDIEAAIRDALAARELDPRFAPAYAQLGILYAYQNKKDAARGQFEACMNAVSTASDCIRELIVSVSMPEGQCKEVETLARKALPINADLFWPFQSLAEAFASQGYPLPSVSESMAQWEQAYGARIDASYREDTFFPAQRLENQTKLDILAGDFVAAEKNAREAVRIRSSSTLLRDHNAPMVALLEILVETGRTELAGKTAKDHLARSAAWEPSARGVDYYKSSFLVYAAAGGQMTDAEYRKQRDVWVEEASAVMTTPLTGRQDIWYNTYAFAAKDAASGREALAILPRYQPLPWLISTKTDFALAGRTYLLAGETAEAIRWLERASHHCGVFSEPLWHMRAHLWLGQAREQQGDKENACAAYKVVLEHWGHAKPKSVTADAASARFHALACRK